MSNTVVGSESKAFKCGRWCKSTYQDKKYGEGWRLHNEMEPEPSAGRSFRCTICKSVHNTEKGKKIPTEKGK